jgi:hypothetical protein
MTVVFDPNIAEHRLAVRAFMKRSSWGDSPIKFKHDPVYGSVANQVQVKLLRWYLDRDEAKEQKKAKSKEVVKDNVKFIESYKTSPAIPMMGFVSEE